MFRLAFRTEAEARASKISNSTITADSFAQTTLTEFAQAAADLLLFNRTVTEISVYVKAAEDSTAELLRHSKASYASMSAPSTVSDMQLQKVTVSTQHETGTSSSKVWARAVSLASPNTQDGVAALLQQSGSTTASAQCSLPEVNGKVYVTLPMPFKVSGLPLHINGAFWIQADRRKLWSGENDGGKVCFLSSG